MATSSVDEGFIENKTFDEISLGDSAHMVRRITRRDIDLFAVISGDLNPTHIDPAYAEGMVCHTGSAHSLLGGAMISAVLGTRLPGPGTVYLSQQLNFIQPVCEGTLLDISVTAINKDPLDKTITFDCRGVNEEGVEVLSGVSKIKAPTEKIRRPLMELGNAELHHHDRMQRMVNEAKKCETLRTAVVHPCDLNSLEGAISARDENLIIPVLVGPEDKIRAIAKEAGISLDGIEIVSTEHSHESAIRAVDLAREGKVGALMKGGLHTDELMGAVVHKTAGLRTESRMSHVFVLDVPSYKFPLLITDAALNIAPDLISKQYICQNAITLAQDIGLALPKVAILAAVETINTNMPSTLEAASLCKMADRGQITGGILDGPLAFDNAISAEAAKIKGIVSPVAGQADILLVPNIESGNMLAKELGYLAGADMAGIVLGAKVPIMLTSRADKAPLRLASAALAVLTMAGQKKRLQNKAGG